MGYEPLNDKKLASLGTKIDEWKKQYQEKGGIRLIEVPGEEDVAFSGIFRIPQEDDIKLSAKKDDESASNLQLCLLCVLYPEPEVFQSVVKKDWGIAVPVTKKLLELSNITRVARAKKL